MLKKISNIFLLLVLVQGLHSIEEYLGRLWENFPPATALCSLFSNDLETGFLIINIGLFVVGMLCWIFLIRPNRSGAGAALGFWMFIEWVNGIGHPLWSIYQGGYTPGMATAPFLLILVVWLTRTYFFRSHR